MKTRLRFTKVGSIKYIGHLDLMRFFQKAIRRAKLDVAYSKGYNPHQLMSFASPLGVGITSDGEYIDVEFNSLPELSKEDFIHYINQYMTDEVFVTDFELLPDHHKTSMALLNACDYMVSFRDSGMIPENIEAKFAEYMSQPQIIIKKKTKRSEKEVDVKPFIHCWAFEASDFQEQSVCVLPTYHGEVFDNGVSIYLKLTAGSVTNIKPELIVGDFIQWCGMSWNPYRIQIHRFNMYFGGEEDE